MAWPSNNKASTTHVDSGTDLLYAARPAIKQDIDNVNAIIDEFTFSNLQDNQGLSYNNNTFQNQNLFVDAFTSVLQFNQRLDTYDSGALDVYQGGFTLVGNTITVNGSEFTIPAGDYYVRTLYRITLLRFGGFEFYTRWLNVADDTEIWSAVAEFISLTGAGVSRLYEVGSVVRLTQDTTVYMEYFNTDDQTVAHPDLIITRI